MEKSHNTIEITMPTTIERLESQGIIVASKDKKKIERLEKYGTIVLYLLLMQFCWLFWSVILPYTEGAWKLPASITFIVFIVWWLLSSKLGMMIMRYEQKN